MKKTNIISIYIMCKKDLVIDLLYNINRLIKRSFEINHFIFFG